MKIVVFGATGRTGQQVVKRALEKGHQVRAFVRNTNALTLLHANLEVMKGDALRQDDVNRAVEKREAVISCLSTTDHAHRLMFTHHLIHAMRQHHVSRMIAIGGIGALQASENLKVYETTTFPREYIDITQAHLRVLDALLNAGLDFTFVCPPLIADGERTGNYQTQASFPMPGWSITTGDLADFMVSELEKKDYIRKKVGISNG